MDYYLFIDVDIIYEFDVFEWLVVYVWWNGFVFILVMVYLDVWGVWVGFMILVFVYFF